MLLRAGVLAALVTLAASAANSTVVLQESPPVASGQATGASGQESPSTQGGSEAGNGADSEDATQSGDAGTAASRPIRNAEALGALFGEIQRQRERVAEAEAHLATLEAGSEAHTRAAGTLDERRVELERLERSFEELATGIDLTVLTGGTEGEFDLRAELENLLKPMLQQLKDVTKNPRQIEQLRMDVEDVDQRLEQVRVASRQLLGMSRNTEGALRAELESRRTRYQTLEKELEDRKRVLSVQLESKLAGRSSIFESSRQLLGTFFRSRGLNVLLGVLAFTGMFLLLRGFGRLLQAWMARRGRTRGFYARLLRVLFQVFVVLASITAVMVVFYAFSDWVLLALTAIFLIGVGWASLNMFPQFFEQIRLVLNLGAVREHERLLLDGVPYDVESLRLYSVLRNPELDGGRMRYPLRDLVGLHSRPTGEGEVWFPTRTGDWVELSDGTYGKVISQSPEVVQLRQLGGVVVYYPTADFLSLAPRNHSHGFRLRVEFGVDYKHQAICLDEIPRKLRDRVEKELRAAVGDALVAVQVEFENAGASSLDYEVQADFQGEVAPRREGMRRRIVTSLVDCCNAEGYVIPFTQVTVHRAELES